MSTQKSNDECYVTSRILMKSAKCDKLIALKSKVVFFKNNMQYQSLTIIMWKYLFIKIVQRLYGGHQAFWAKRSIEVHVSVICFILELEFTRFWNLFSLHSKYTRNANL